MNNLMTLNSVFLSNLFIPIVTIIVSAILSLVIAYFTARYQYRKQYDNGKILLYEIVKRYFILLKENHKIQEDILEVNTDAFSRDFYDSELSIIYNDFKSIFNNPIMIRYFKNYSGLSKLVISINREIISRKTKSIVNPVTIIGFIDIYNLLKIEIGIKKIQNNKDLKEIDDIVGVFNQLTIGLRK